MKSMSDMFVMNRIAIFIACLLVAYATPTNNTNARAGCTVTSFEDVSNAVLSCSDIIISGITVPGGQALDLKDLKDGATVTFDGYIKFEYYEWDGPMVDIKGKGITIKGNQGNVLDGQGALYWDGQGGHGGVTKPKFVRLSGTGGSVAKDVNILNCPRACVSIWNSDDFTVSNWNVDVSDGDENGGHNTDGIGILYSTNIVVENSVVWNQDDCVVINYASNLQINGLTCYGGHGLSLSVGLYTNGTKNTVSNVVFSDCNVIDSANGLHIKTHSDGGEGYIRDVTYRNLKLSGITNFGIEIQEDYTDPGHPKANVPISKLTLENISGTMTGTNSMPLYIVCADGGCSDWQFSDISISGNGKKSSCNYTPSGFSC